MQNYKITSSSPQGPPTQSYPNYPQSPSHPTFYPRHNILFETFSISSILSLREVKIANRKPAKALSL